MYSERSILIQQMSYSSPVLCQTLYKVGNGERDLNKRVVACIESLVGLGAEGVYMK